MGSQRIRHDLATEQQQGATKSPWGPSHWASGGSELDRIKGRQEGQVRAAMEIQVRDEGGLGLGGGTSRTPRGEGGAPGSMEYEPWLQAAPWAAEAGGGGTTSLLCPPAAQAEPSRAVSENLGLALNCATSCW